jgi:hypothetical protein
VSDIAKGILSGGWLLVAGWILPTAINVLVFGFFVLPSLHAIAIFGSISNAGVTERSLAILGVAVVAGLVLNALQAPLYRILEGYLWPAGAARKMRNRQLRAKHILEGRLEGIRLRALEAKSRLEKPEDKQRLAKLSADPRLNKFAERDQARTAVQRSLLRERLRRYPVDDDQVAPTRLGNAIRRLEEYGYNRYRLDSQALWYELIAVSSKQLSQQVDTARAGVDFFVCLLYGQLLVAAAALAGLAALGPHDTTLLVTAGTLIVLTPLSYRLAWVTTDDWAYTVRALVDLGRKPLAESLGLCLPVELKAERIMWRRYSRMVSQPYDKTHVTDLDEFRSQVKSTEQRENSIATDPTPYPDADSQDSGESGGGDATKGSIQEADNP